MKADSDNGSIYYPKGGSVIGCDRREIVWEYNFGGFTMLS